MTPRTYNNPVVRGFFPDPSVLRVGDDYYLAHSTFQYFPGVVITHSRDLVHWKTLGHVFLRDEDLDLVGLDDSHGLWAPDLSCHEGQFLLYVTLRLNNPAEGDAAPRRRQLMTTAPHPLGPWAPPTTIELDDIDPSHFVDTDGSRYLLLAPGATLYPLSADGKAVSGPPQVIWAGTGRRAPEGPRLLYHDGWYVLLLAEGGTEWEHCVTVARSRTLRGPYESCPHNPILTQTDRSAPLQRTGHGQLVETAAGDWWMVYLCGRPNRGPFTTLGRETALDPVTWVDGWPVVNQGRGPSLRQGAPRLPEAPQCDPGFDDFDSPRLSPIWQFVRNPRPGSWSLGERPGWLRLTGTQESLTTKGRQSTLLRREQHHHYAARTRLDANEGVEAGLTCYYDRLNHLALAIQTSPRPLVQLNQVKDGSATVLNSVEVPPGPLVLEVEVRGQERTFRVQARGQSWRTVGRVADASFLSDEGVVTGKHHTGTLVGLFARSRGSENVCADFDWFDYRPHPARDASQKSPKGGHQNPGSNGYANTMMSSAVPTASSSTKQAPWLNLARSVLGRHQVGSEKWHYEHGLLLGALEEVGLRTGDPAFGRFVEDYMKTLVAPDGRILTYRDDEFNLDQVNPGKVAMVLAARTDDSRWKACLPRLRDQLVHQPRTASGGFWHKKIYPDQMWLDGLYMQGPFLARWGREYGNSSDFDEVVFQLNLIETKARDEATGLLYHAWDESRRQLWAHPDTGCSPHFWSRALGWYAMALVDVLDWLPATHVGAKSLPAILGRLAMALSKVQDAASGLWFQVLDQADRPGNYLETSGSSMFTYALFKGLRKGWLADPEGTYRRMADRAWEGLVNRCLSQSSDGSWHLDGICSVAGLGGTPYRDGSFQYYVSEPVVSDDFKGVGPFFLAGLEQEKLS